MGSKHGEDYRKKKRVKTFRESPFPVPIATITGLTCDENYWYHYTGRLQNNSVIVTHSGDVRYLYKMGFFGRGMLSRGAPVFHETMPYVYLTTKTENEPDIVKVMKRRMYLRHKHWHQLVGQDDDIDPDQMAVTDLEFDSDVEWNQDENCHDVFIYGDDNADSINKESKLFKTVESHQDISAMDSSNKDRVSDSWASTEGDSTIWTSDVNANESQSKPVISKQGDSQLATNRESRTCYTWDNSDGDVAFWTNETNANVDDIQNDQHFFEQGDNVNIKCDSANQDKLEMHKNLIDAWDNSEADADFWATPSITLKADHTTSNDLDICDLDKSNQGQRSNDNSEHTAAKKRRLDNHSMSVVETNDLLTRTKDNIESGVNNCNVFDIKGKSVITQNEKAGSENSKIVKKDISNSENFTASVTNDAGQSGVHSNCLDENNVTVTDNNQIVENDENKKESEDYETHPCCHSDDSDADHLVIDDYHEGQMTRRCHQWQPVMKKDPYLYTEPLVLTAEEVIICDPSWENGPSWNSAFFLSYGLGCLTVNDGDQNKSLTLKELWVTFCQQPRFLPCYAAYHYFRSRGWVPKPGILFGTDFLLYKEGPPFFHGSYSVVVKTVYSGTYQTVEEYSNRTLSWSAFSGLQRVTEHVVKTLLFCFVIIPRDLTEEEKASPKCLSRLNIHIQKYSRWVSSQERDSEKATDIP